MAFCGISSHDPEFAFENASPDDVDAHMRMLFDGDLIDSGTDVRGPLDGSWYFQSLTWAGRDFLDSVRQDGTWQKTKGVLQKSGGWTLSLITEVAKQLIKGELQKHGLPLA